MFLCRLAKSGSAINSVGKARKTKELPPANYRDQLPPKPDRPNSEASGEIQATAIL
jgi:hypothetical protein